jgi:hypothetical protein
LHMLAPVIGALLVIAIGKWMVSRAASQAQLQRTADQPAN